MISNLLTIFGRLFKLIFIVIFMVLWMCAVVLMCTVNVFYILFMYLKTGEIDGTFYEEAGDYLYDLLDRFFD